MNTRNVKTQFSKEDLAKIADELGLELKPFSRMPTIISAINDDLDENGIPAEDECSELLERYLIIAGFIGDDGEVLEVSKDKENIDEETEVISLNVLPAEMPECFSLADIQDPSCKRCAVFDMCHEKRIERRPPCFGLYFSDSADECAICIEAPACRRVFVS